LNSPLRTLVSVVIALSRCPRLRRRACEIGWWPIRRVRQDRPYTADVRKDLPHTAHVRKGPLSNRCRAGLFRPARSVAVVALTGFTIVSVPQEIEIGREENAQVRKQVAQLRDPQVTAYIARIGKRLAAAAPGAKYPYSFTVANYREINAFSLPGGPVWINRGVLHAAGNEAQVAGVLAHEIAHISERHAADQMTKAIVARWSLGMLGAMLGNAGGAGTAQVAGALVTNGVFLKFSRDDEREADRVGVQIMTKAGWDPRGMIELFDVLQREGKRNPGEVEVFLSTHPSPADRIAQLKTATTRSRGGIRDTAEFRAVRARVLKLPPPRPMPPT
jgi:predicted Zn-dependent protease